MANLENVTPQQIAEIKRRLQEAAAIASEVEAMLIDNEIATVEVAIATGMQRLDQVDTWLSNISRLARKRVNAVKEEKAKYKLSRKKK